MTRLTLHARAKINTFLKIGPKRKDGFHSLETEFQEISLCDELSFRLLEAPIIQLTVEGASIPTGRDNLIVRALAALRTKVKTRHGIYVHLKKHIPMGAGLGGGSSDAAAALWGGWLLWTRRKKSDYRIKTPAVLKEIAPTLGSDVSFFLAGGRALGRGKGEKLTPLSTSARQWMILVYPRTHVSTPKAYAWLDQHRAKFTKSETKFQNDFEPVVVRKVPLIGRALRKLTALGCQNVQMSGSGSAVFGYVDNKEAGIKIKRQLALQSWDVWVVCTTN